MVLDVGVITVDAGRWTLPHHHHVPHHVVVCDLRGFGLGDEPGDRQKRVRRERRVDRERSVEVRVADRLLVDDDAADFRARENVAAVAGDEKVLAWPGSDLLGLDVHHGDVVPLHFTGQPSAADDWYRLAPRQPDPPREEQVRQATPGVLRFNVEHACIFEKKVPFFGKEQRKTRQVDLLLVYFDLGEVSVQRDVKVEPCGDAVFHIEADVV